MGRSINLGSKLFFLYNYLVHVISSLLTWRCTFFPQIFRWGIYFYSVCFVDVLFRINLISFKNFGSCTFFKKLITPSKFMTFLLGHRNCLYICCFACDGTYILRARNYKFFPRESAQGNFGPLEFPNFLSYCFTFTLRWPTLPYNRYAIWGLF